MTKLFVVRCTLVGIAIDVNEVAKGTNASRDAPG